MRHLSIECETYIRQLLLAGELSHRSIAKKAGVDRKTVHNVLHRMRSGILPQPPSRSAAAGYTAIVCRCTGCGHRVAMPCLECFLERLRPLLGKKR